MTRYLDLNYLLQNEVQTQQVTRSKLQGIYTNYPQIIDTFIKLIYFYGKLENPDSPRGSFQSMCVTHYAQAPYTFIVLYDLYEKGYYLEAQIISRHLIETFIQIKYFNKYPEKLEDQLLRKNFKEMFEEFATGYYKKYYNIHCDAAHGSLVKDIFRMDRSTTKNGRIRMGCEFNDKFASELINEVTAFIFGYFNIFQTIFPKNTLNKEDNIHDKFLNSKDWLLSCMEAHKKEYPQSQNWYKYIDLLIK